VTFRRELDAFDQGYLGIGPDDEDAARANLEAYLELMRRHLPDYCDDDESGSEV